MASCHAVVGGGSHSMVLTVWGGRFSGRFKRAWREGGGAHSTTRVQARAIVGYEPSRRQAGDLKGCVGQGPSLFPTSGVLRGDMPLGLWIGPTACLVAGLHHAADGCEQVVSFGQTTVSFGSDETFGMNQLGPTGMHGARLQPFNWCVGNGWSERVLSAREGGMVGFSAWR